MIDVVCCTDGNYVMQTSVLILSTCSQNAQEEITFHIITDGSVTAKDKRRMEGVIAPFGCMKMLFYCVKDEWFESLKVSSAFTKATFYRLSMAEILPPTVNKVLYLDGDMIVTGSIRPLWDMDISDVALAAVPDVCEDDPSIYERLEYPQELGYFNGGVQLINIAYWRREKMLPVFLGLVRKNPERFKYYDQDVLNCVFNRKKKVLPLKYNVQNEVFFKVKNWDTKKFGASLEEAIKKPVIVHFTRSQKPWIVGCPHPYTAEFNRYREMTPWRHRSIIDTLKYSGLRHTVGYYTRKWGMKAPMDNPYSNGKDA